MLSKEEIEKAKEMLSNPKKEDLIEIIRIFKRNGIENYCITKNETIETLLQYTDQQEKENNKLNKIIDEMVDEYEYNAGCNLKNFCDEKIRKDKCIQDCRACIKQHFEKKVEEK